MICAKIKRMHNYDFYNNCFTIPPSLLKQKKFHYNKVGGESKNFVVANNKKQEEVLQFIKLKSRT